MTLVKHGNMVKFKHDQQFQTRRTIIQSLFKMGEGTSNEIHQYINENKSNSVPETYIDERGFEAAHQTDGNETISLRTIQRNLNHLCDQALVKKEGKLYSLVDPLRASRFFGPRFGARILDNLIGPPDYELKTVKQNLDYLIRLFGTIIVFCCMEGARPKSNFNIPGDDSNDAQLMSTISWINSVISPASLYHYFMFVFKNQLDDEMIPKLRRVHFSGKLKGKKNWMDYKSGKEYNFVPVPIFIDDKDKPFYTGFYRDIPFVDEYLHMDKYANVHIDYEPPLDEIKPQIYTRLVRSLRELAPEMSSKLEELRTDKNHEADFLYDTS